VNDSQHYLINSFASRKPFSLPLQPLDLILHSYSAKCAAFSNRSVTLFRNVAVKICGATELAVTLTFFFSFLEKKSDRPSVKMPTALVHTIYYNYFV
jgi:hypothetical protein